MFVADHVGNRSGVHPFQDLQSLAALARHDPAQHRRRFIVTQGAFHDFFDVVARAQAQAGLLLQHGHKLIEHDVHRLLRQVGHGHHGTTQRLHFFGVQKPNDLGRLLFAQQEHQHRCTLSTRQGVQLFLQFFGYHDRRIAQSRCDLFDCFAVFALGVFAFGVLAFGIFFGVFFRGHFLSLSRSGDLDHALEHVGHTA